MHTFCSPRILLALCIAAAFLLGVATDIALAQSPTFVDGATYVQYSDDAVALADVGAGRLDMHYGGLPPDLADAQDGSTKIYESQSGSYSLLVNPALGDELNVFSDRDARYALNYIIDRSLVVNELLGGHGTKMSLAYAPHDPDYAALAASGLPRFSYNPALAEQLMAGALERQGASLQDGAWVNDGEPVIVRIFIRSDDAVRKSIGELLALELSKIGLQVEREYGDLNKAFVVVYGSDPAALRWNIYTEGWGGKAGFVRYDPVVLAQMYAPWFSSMPGFNDPSYWNYEHPELDELTGAIYSGQFANAAEREEIIRKAAAIGIAESVRVFLAAGSVLYAAGSDVDGIVNDFGAGIPSRFTPINAQTPSGHLRIGVSEIYQGAWNPVMGFGDIHSSRIWSTLSDPAVFRHPYTGSPIPVRASWDVHTGGPDPSIDVPPTAIVWDAPSQSWMGAEPGTVASSAVTFELAMSEWHHGQMMDMHDVMYAVYFALEWGSERTTSDSTFDAEFASRAGQFISTLRGVEPLDDNRVRVYVDYWHFDEAEIASWASVWAAMPWEIYAGMERAVSTGEASFSRSGAGASGIPWLSLAVESDAQLVSDHIGKMRSSEYVPPPLEQLDADVGYAMSRYDSTLEWIGDRGHAIISNGPFYLEGYRPESRTIKTQSFDSESYPFEQGRWRHLANVDLARIANVDVPRTHPANTPMSVHVLTEHASKLRYTLSAPGMVPASSGTADVSGGEAMLVIPASVISEIGVGAANITLYATSDDALRPDIFSIDFAIVPAGVSLPPLEPPGASTVASTDDSVAIAAMALLGAGLVAFLALWRRRSARLYASDK